MRVSLRLISEAARRIGRRRFAALFAAGAGVMLASCGLTPTPGSGSHFSEAEYGVKTSPRVVGFGQSVPSGGGRYMVGKPYMVAGRMYVPRDVSHYSAIGLASWYGSDFHGRRTANGEVYDMGALTAAHPTLPLPSYVRVTNLSNGRSMIVRVNDRGPYRRNRLLDVSERVADMLDFERSGTARVKVDYVGPANLDGRDRKMLLASYRAPDGPAPDTLFAAATPPPPAPARVILASAPVFRLKPSAAPVYSAASAPMKINPTYTAPGGKGDPLGPLILRTGFTSSYASSAKLSPAHAAAAGLASGVAGEPTVASDLDGARHLQKQTIVQLGAFSDPSNAQRVVARFAGYGQIVTFDQAVGGKTLRVVRVILADASVPPQSVMTAAASAGLAGCHLLAN